MNLLTGEITKTGKKTTVKLDGGGTAKSAVLTTDEDMGEVTLLYFEKMAMMML